MAPRYAPLDAPALRSLLSNSNRRHLYCGAGAEDAVGAVIGGGTFSTCLMWPAAYAHQMSTTIPPTNPSRSRDLRGLSRSGSPSQSCRLPATRASLSRKCPVLVRDPIKMRARPSPGKTSRHAPGNQGLLLRFGRFAAPAVVLDNFCSRVEISRRNSSFSISA